MTIPLQVERTSSNARQPGAGRILRFTSTVTHALSDGASRQAIALTGHWVKRTGQKIDITKPMLEEMQQNFGKEPTGVNVDYDHASESPLLGLLGPSPSAGRLVKVDPVEDFGGGVYVLHGYYDPTAKAREMVKAKEYRYFSLACEPVPNKKTGVLQGWTITSLALTNKPVVGELPEIRLAQGAGLLMSDEGGRVCTMINPGTLDRRGVEARIESLTAQRMADFGESRQFAEIQVTRTTEGRDLWEQARKIRLADSYQVNLSPAPRAKPEAISCAERELESLIAKRMSDAGESRDMAENAVIHTSEGLSLWERARKLRLADSEVD